ncbi:hypothetical protein DID77_03830 [Candidatus Marinamargulisbacteria bacterium SCGC AG-439-L15]|nr:hypothetical protein DID77_03830 [Candidatus Marinamargulisbacteria bacterium SCGC AG-439-L15]
MLQKRKNRIVVALVFFAIFFSAYPIDARPSLTKEVYSFPSQNRTKLVSYQNVFYYYDTANKKLVKMTAQGQIEWELPFKKHLSIPLLVQFGRLYAVSEKGQLFCYDAHYGYVLFGPVVYGIHALLIQYPMVVVSTDKDRLMGLDFNTGQILWNRSIPNINRFYYGSFNTVLAYDDKWLWQLNMVTGKNVKRLQVSSGVGAVVYRDPDYLVLKKSGKLLSCDFEKGTIRSGLMSIEQRLLKTYDTFGVFYSATNDWIQARNYGKKEYRWSFSLPKKKAVEIWPSDQGILIRQEQSLFWITDEGSQDPIYYHLYLTVEDARQFRQLIRRDDVIILVFKNYFKYYKVKELDKVSLDKRETKKNG